MTKSYLQLTYETVAPNEVDCYVPELCALDTIEFWFILYNFDSWNILEEKDHILKLLRVSCHELGSQDICDELVATSIFFKASKFLLLFDFLSYTDNV